MSPDVRCTVIPGSPEIFSRMVKEGVMEVFTDADAVVSTPTFGRQTREYLEMDFGHGLFIP